MSKLCHFIQDLRTMHLLIVSALTLDRFGVIKSDPNENILSMETFVPLGARKSLAIFDKLGYNFPYT